RVRYPLIANLYSSIAMSSKLSQLFFKFSPIYKNVTWGGTEIFRFKDIPEEGSCVGESWEISGVKEHESIVDGGNDNGMILSELVAKYKGSLVGDKNYATYGNKFPLLIKFIDARNTLSVQVHPNEQLAQERHNCSGKSEMWYIIHAEDDAKMYIGLSQTLSHEEYDRHVNEKSLLNVIEQHTPRAGNSYYIPAGRVHSIGAGILLLEVQQASDITYRIYDFDRKDINGNLRELHTELAKEAIDLNVNEDCICVPESLNDSEERLVKCPYFDVKKIDIDGEFEIEQNDNFTIAVCVEGELQLTATGAGLTDSTTLRCGFSTLIAASATNIKVTGTGKLITVTT
ncbi:MAG: class I mannose-6-phosphate isomerase, partial [Muribaculaceae bacterium]|nr:class I mannose-6-phosphate isomerase [Muribaculaceae bacterium]